MVLTPAQITTLQAWIESNFPDAPLTVDGSAPIAEALSALADPAMTVYRTQLALVTVLENGVDWVEIGGLNQNRARILEYMEKIGIVNPSKVNVRNGFERMFEASPNSLVAARVLMRRPARTVEAIFATGAGTDADPATLAIGADGNYVEGALSAAGVWLIRVA